jgi:hypothetical protein
VKRAAVTCDLNRSKTHGERQLRHNLLIILRFHLDSGG